MKKIDITVLQHFAISKKGLLLSSIYLGSNKPVIWQCSDGHSWKARWSDINTKHSWCPICASSKYNIKTLQQYAINKKGLLLSTEYINKSQLLLWQCEHNHIWKASWSNIKNHNGWCPNCLKPDITILQQYAIKKHGYLLSTTYTNNTTKYLWACEKGHLWQAKWNTIKDGDKWCPECSSFKTELLCKTIFEEFCQKPFIKIRFYYDKLNKNKFYELDGYNEELKLAFEYHGYQHYEYPNYWHKTENIFKAAQQRDKNKETWCLDNGIKLIIIPYTERSNLKQYIKERI